MPEAREAAPSRRRRADGVAIAVLAVSGAVALAAGAALRPSAPAAPDFQARTAPSASGPRAETLPGRFPASLPHASARPDGPPARPAPARTDEPRGRQAPPRGVEIPRVGLDAPVVPVGVDRDGGAEVPADPGRAGWYRFGPAPGEPSGSAVLMGHVDSRSGDLGEFAALFDVRAGDTVLVRRDGAPPVSYRITSRATVDKGELPASAFARSGPPVLTLITCAAPYDPDRGGYLRNLVVTAVPLPAKG
ncbi:sortase domain-bontaining protein [Streptomyces sp. NPDC058757]|uniref:class F sortase n=1 Tax=unclassified Streptomyces TaxID=2593676 RepID=UPI0036CC72CA